MWALVDYSTISNEAITVFPASTNNAGPSTTLLPATAPQNTYGQQQVNSQRQWQQQDEVVDLANGDTEAWFDSWMDLFGGDMPGNSASMVDVAMEGRRFVP